MLILYFCQLAVIAFIWAYQSSLLPCGETWKCIAIIRWRLDISVNAQPLVRTENQTLISFNLKEKETAKFYCSHQESVQLFTHDAKSCVLLFKMYFYALHDITMI